MEPLPVDAPAPAPGAPADDVMVRLVAAAIEQFMHAVRERNWLLASGIALMGTVVVLRWAFPRLPPQFVPLGTALLATIPTIAVVLKRPDVSPAEVIQTAVIVWLASSGAWENAAKPLKHWWDKRRAPKTTPPPAPSPPPAPPDVQ